MNEKETKLIIGTRGSKLALWQANHTKSKLAELGILSELKIIKTKGDKIQNLSFDKIEGKGFFTKELEDHLLDSTIDIAVHSLKDMPTSQPDRLVLAAVLEREDPSDWLIIHKESVDLNKSLSMIDNPTIGTSSARRKSQILYLQPDATIEDIRGNVPTRLQKLADKKYDAILLAAAGLIRLGLDLSEFKIVKFNPKEFVPAPGQGVITIQTRQDAIDIRRILKNIHNPEVAQCSNVERGVLQLFDGGCHLPLGVHCQKDKAGNYHVNAAYSENIFAPIIYGQVSSSTTLGLIEQVYHKIQRN